MRHIEQAKICFVAGTLGKGGAEKQAFYLIKILKEHGHEVMVVYYGDEHWWKGRIEQLGIPVINVRAVSKTSRLVETHKIIKRLNLDIIQAVHYHMNPYVVALAKVLGAKSVGAFRGDGKRELRTLNELIRIPTFKFGNAFIVNSKHTLKSLSVIPSLKNKIYYMPNVVDIPTKPRASLNKTATEFIAVNSLIKLKRMDRVLRFFAQYVKNEPNAQLTVLGDGMIKSALVDLTKQLHLTDQVFFEGVVNDTSTYYEKADVLLFASESEGTPNVVLEGMSYGKVVITSDVGDTTNLVRHGETGFILDFENDVDVSATIALLQNQWGTVQQMGKMAHEEIIATYSYAHLYSNITSIYKQL
jgi:glycosyltransferase involved in cell wall biosynthesis